MIFNLETMPDGKLVLHRATVQEDDYLTGEWEHVIVPQGVTCIDDGAFSDMLIKSIILPEGITHISNSAFSCCDKLISITLPNSLISIGEYAFYGCESLSSVTLPRSLIMLGGAAFAGCKRLQKFKVSKKSSYFCTIDGILYDKECRTLIACPSGYEKDVSVPNGVRTIGIQAFMNCHRIKKIILPEGLANIEEAAFQDCISLTSITLPKSLRKIGDSDWLNFLDELGYYGGVFKGCSSLSGIVLPKGVKSVEPYTFWGCTNLKKIVIPEGVTYIGEGAFGECKLLESVTLPKSVENISLYVYYVHVVNPIMERDSLKYNARENAFYSCNKLTLQVHKDSYAEAYACKAMIPYNIICDDV